MCGQLELQCRIEIRSLFSVQHSNDTILLPLLLLLFSSPSPPPTFSGGRQAERWTLGRPAEIQQQAKQAKRIDVSLQFFHRHPQRLQKRGPGRSEEISSGGGRYRERKGDPSTSTLIQLSPLISSDLSQDGHTPLILACYKGHTEVALFLIKKGASINHQNIVRVACP
jgi:hypothetical protein